MLEKSVWPFYFIFFTNNHRYKITSTDQKKLTLVEQHFRTNGHDFNRVVKFSIRERIEVDINIKSIT